MPPANILSSLTQVTFNRLVKFFCGRNREILFHREHEVHDKCARCGRGKRVFTRAQGRSVSPTWIEHCPHYSEHEIIAFAIHVMFHVTQVSPTRRSIARHLTSRAQRPTTLEQDTCALTCHHLPEGAGGRSHPSSRFSSWTLACHSPRITDTRCRQALCP
jgi:hypothetical protein